MTAEPAEKLPIEALAKEALLLPFNCFDRFLWFGFVPMIVTAVAQIAGGMLAALTGHWYFNGLWLIATGLAEIPFSVAWTRLVVRGPATVRNKPCFAVGKTERRYLTALLVLIFGLFGPAVAVALSAWLSGWPWLLLVATALMVTGMLVGLRLMFVLPAVATGNYRGLRVAWDQTKGVVPRVLGVCLLSALPISVGSSIIHTIEGHLTQPAARIVLAVADIVLMFISSAVNNGALSLCYRYQVTRDLVPPVQAATVG